MKTSAHLLSSIQPMNVNSSCTQLHKLLDSPVVIAIISEASAMNYSLVSVT